MQGSNEWINMQGQGLGVKLCESTCNDDVGVNMQELHVGVNMQELHVGVNMQELSTCRGQHEQGNMQGSTCRH